MQSHKLSQQELQQLLETVDVLRLLTARGQQEMRHVAPYLIGWGLYGVLNQVLQLVLHRAFWAEGMFLAFAIATGLLFGVFPTVLYWVGAAVLGIGSLYLFAQQPALVFVVFAVAIFAAMLLSYTTAARQGRPAEMPFRVSLAQKLGVLWGALTAGSWLFVLAVSRGEPAVSGMWFSGILGVRCGDWAHGNGLPGAAAVVAGDPAGVGVRAGAVPKELGSAARGMAGACPWDVPCGAAVLGSPS
jgi:hypothetical protein